VFFSPGFVKVEETCSICGTVIKPRNRCDHRRFELYGGEMCGGIITKSKMLQLAIVERPVQKFSVGFYPTPYDYSVVHYAVSGCRVPWSKWNVNIENRGRPHPKLNTAPYRGLSPNDVCGCGSGKKFKKGCQGSTTTTLHHQFLFHDPPGDGVPRYQPGTIREGKNEPRPEPRESEGLAMETNLPPIGSRTDQGG